MTIDKTIAAILLVPLIGLAIPATVFFRKLPPADLSASENELIAFSSQPVAVLQPGRLAVYSGLECPVRPTIVTGSAAKAADKNFPPGPIPSASGAAAQQKNLPLSAELLPGVTMIYSDGRARIAIIDGHVLHEGASIGSSKVVKIEKKRVLLRTTGKDIWLNID